jgi:hypothetical protein
MDMDQEAEAWLEQELDREVMEVDAAIALVRSGVATVVSLANLRHGKEVLHQLRERGVHDDVRLDVRLESRPWSDDVGCDLDVRLISA